MPRPEQRTITFTIDGREVQAPENSMLVDAAKHGDVEIPVFCYEPKLGQPVGACRMCLVEIEGMPKLQTGCSTAVKDGMVVHTGSPRAKQAQEGVVEFLLANHPLDCPVCDKGGECPLQDISFGWGNGRSRFVEPKRHFVKPLELSSTIAIDRERCILCYRCVRFSQEISEDNLLVLLERGADSYVGTFDGNPYEAPFAGNIIELCPVGALTSRPYRFTARPWDIEGSGSVCTLCPSQCNVTLTIRDERVMRVLARHNPDVDDGWLCDRGRFAFPALERTGEEAEVLSGVARVTEPLLRDGGALRAVSWERALEEAATLLSRAGARTGALAGGGTTNEEGLLLGSLLREGLRSPHLDSRPAGQLPLDLHRALAAGELQAKVPDLEFAHAVLVLECDPIADSPILDLRLRKGARRHGLKIVRASREQLLDGTQRSELIEQLRAAGPAQSPSGDAEQSPLEVVVLWHERLGAGPDGERAVRTLLDLAAMLELSSIDGAGLLEIPAHANGRGLREAGVLPNAGPQLSEIEEEGLDGHGIAEAFERGELSCLYLLGVDPPAGGGVGGGGGGAGIGAIIAHAAFMTDALRERASVVFPAEAYPEKEGTVTHPDGRLQRVRRGARHLGEVRDERHVLDELASRVGMAVAS
jgi:NADH-quinone oxidoreductase subunit G